MKYIKLFESKIPKLKIGDYKVLFEVSIFEFFDTNDRCVFWFNIYNSLKFIQNIEDNESIFEIGHFEIIREDDGIRIYEDPEGLMVFCCFFDKKYIPDLIYFLKNPTLSQNMDKFNL